MLLRNIFYILLMLCLSFFLYWFAQVLVDIKKRDFLGVFFKSLNEKYEQRQIEKEAKELYEGSVEKKKFIDKVDNLIERSGIRKTFRNLTGEILISMTLILALSVTIMTNVIFEFWLYNIAAFILTIVAVFFMLKIMAKRTFNGIDKQILTYVNTLKNLSVSNSDIVDIFEKSIAYSREPLRQYVLQFVFEAKKGVPLDKAFKNFEKNIENNRFKQLLRNLYVASKHEANYKEVLSASRNIFKHYLSEKKRRESTVRQGRIGILIISLMGVVVFKMSGAFVNGSMIEKLKYTFVGNILLGYFLAVFIYTIYTFITLDKLNY